MKKIIIIFVMIFISAAGTITASNTLLNSQESPVQVFLETEQGFISILNHTYQIGDTADNFNFRTQGGQEILFPFERYTVGVELYDTHRISFTYQPLELFTQVTFRDEVTIDQTTFTDGTAMDITYGFPFYRVTYTYDFLGNDSRKDIGLGVSLQLRNASIRFASADGSLLAVSQNLGPVPALSFYSNWEFPFGLVLAAEATGSYASSAIFNGADFAFEGSILDASLRAGYRLRNGSILFGNLRYFGGSAVGTSQYPDRFWTEGLENYTANYISSLTVSLGLTVN